MTHPMARRCRKGFTIIEILIVLVILGLLAAVVVISFGDSHKDAQQIAFISNVEIFGNAARVYWVKTGEHLEDSASGTVPAGWDSYIDARKWTQLTPIGGVWDVEKDSYGVQSALGVDFANGGGEDRDDAYMLDIDKTMDNGDLSTGRFRKIAPGRYYFILME
jgi:prepilin-type N-terminal cleavage/methylation domain-containing protein